MAYKVINTSDADLNRVQQNVATAFGELAPGLAIRQVLSSATATSERIATTDRYVIVNSRGGPIKMVLPSPTVKQEVTVKNATTSANAVTIVQQDGKPTGDGETAIPVTGLAAVTMVSDGTAWRRLTVGLGSIIPAAEPVTPPIPPLPPTPPSPPSISGPFWMSTDVGMTGAVDMGFLGNGVLQQLAVAGIAYPEARSLNTGQVVYGAPDGLIDQVAQFYFHEATLSLGVGTNAPFATVHAYGATVDKLAVLAENPTQAGVSALRLAGYLGPDVTVGPGVTANASAEIYYTGNTHSGPAGADIPDPVNAMVFNLPNPGFPSNGGHGWLWRTDDIAMMRLPFASDIVELDVVVGRAVYTGGNAGIKLTTNLGTSAKTILTSSANSTDGPDLLITRYAGDYVIETGSVSVTDLVAGGIVYADPATVGLLPTATLKLVTIGTGLSFAGGTLSATGGTGTVTAVTASDGLSSSGGTTPNITHDDSALAPGAHGSTGIASFTTDVNGHVTAVTTASYVATTRTLAATAPVRIDGGAGPLDLSANRTFSLSTDATMGVLGGQLTMIPFTGSGPGSLKGAVPDPGAVAGSTRYLCEDGTWSVAPGTGVPTARTLAATSPILIDGGAGPLDLSANRTFSHATSGAAAAAYPWANVTVNATGHVTAISTNAAPQPVITWPAATRILVSTGTTTDPTGDSAFTYITADDHMRNDGPVTINAAMDAIGTGYLWTVQATAARDRAWWALGGVTISDGVNREWFTIAPASTTVNTAGIALLATMRVRATNYTLTGVAAGTVASVYADQPTFNGGTISDPNTQCWVFYGGGGTTSQSKLEGALITNSIATGLGQFAGDGSNVFDLPTDNTGNTSAAIGRIPVNIAGITKYIRYYND